MEETTAVKEGCKLKDDQNENLAATDARKIKGACWNCGEKGHHRAKCPKPLKKKKAKFFKKRKDSENTIDSDSEADRVYAVTYGTDESDHENDDKAPESMNMSDSSCSDSEYPQDNVDNNEASFSVVAEDNDLLSNTEDTEDNIPIEAAIAITPDKAEPASHIELYVKHNCVNMWCSALLCTYSILLYSTSFYSTSFP